MRRILIVGGGFAGVTAANAIIAQLTPRRRIDVHMVSQDPYFSFTPLVPNVAGGTVDAATIAVPLHEALGDRVTFDLDTIKTIDPISRVARGNFDHPFDFLILCPGSQTVWPQAHWVDFCYPCRHAQDAAHIHEVVLRAFQDPRAATESSFLRFVVVGGGPTGVSLVSELQAFIDEDLLTTFPEYRERVELVLVEKASNLMPDLASELGVICQDHLERNGVRVLLNQTMTDCSPNGVYLDTGFLETRHIFWCGGVEPAPLVDHVGLALDSQRRILVDEHLRAVDQFGIYVIGDCAAGQWPWSAQVAVQQANIAAHNVLSDTIGRSYRGFEHAYQGDIITLGRQNAAVFFQGLAFEGRAAKTLYRAIYTALVPSNIRKIQVFRNWLTPGRGRPQLER